MSYEFTAELADLLASQSTTPVTDTPPSVSSVEGGLLGLVLELGSKQRSLVEV